MGTAPRLAIASALIGSALLSTGRETTTEQPPGTVSVSVGYATPVSDLRRWDAAVDRMVRTGELVVMARLDDRTLAGRIHEQLAQHVAGIAVHGGGVSRQLDRGVTVSLFGTLYRDVEVETARALSRGEAAARIAGATGEALATSPRLIILPWPDGSYALAYRAATEDGRLHFADAMRGGLVQTVDAFSPTASGGPDAGPGAGIATDFGFGARLGPRRFTDHDGRAYTCDAARFPVRVRGVWQSLPALCDDGRFILASPQGRGVVDALSDIFPGTAGVFRTGTDAAASGPPAHDGWGSAGSLEDPWSQGAPGAYPFRTEFALAADQQSWRYTGFTFAGGRFIEASDDCCHDGRAGNSAILGHAFHLAVEGGTNRGTGLAVAGAGPAHRELIGQVFHRALTELLPAATSFPQAADAIRQSAADLAPGSAVQRAVEQALEAVGLPPLHEAEGDHTGAPPDSGAGERRGGHSPAYAALPPRPAATAGGSAAFDVQATEVGHYNYESPHSNPIALLPDGSLLYAANTPADTVDVIDTATRAVVARVDCRHRPGGRRGAAGRQGGVGRQPRLRLGQRDRRRPRQPHPASRAGHRPGLRRRHPVDALRRAGGHRLRGQRKGLRGALVVEPGRRGRRRIARGHHVPADHRPGPAGPRGGGRPALRRAVRVEQPDAALGVLAREHRRRAVHVRRPRAR